MNIPEVATRTSVPTVVDYEAALDRALNALLRYGRCDDGCPSHADPDNGRCECGLGEAIVDPMLWTVHGREWRKRMVALHGEDFVRRMLDVPNASPGEARS